VGGVTDVSSIRPRLGIAAQSVADYPAALRAQLALPEDGVVVLEVQPGSVADRAGLRGSRGTIVLDSGAEVPAPGDVIVAVDGEPVDEVEDITLRVTFGADAGDRVVLGVIRDGQRLRVPVTLEVSTANAFEAPSAD
jgi:S1-C subfamily serine protease